ncbi:SGNH/GDSL hydrolase family protein [Variovorax sp. YR216]|uniref:SGNH/GDSL hydrolase family protein n=1 Tax=Variovorax sp. YR216 TaxID=1882828 RepID=UPI0008978F03|nr:SGNH/GDSL hydrolase family protein [Variovorax sp. YR216]SEB11652.1 GDSL-like Lipase/Acylhydrolase family protein [Variovorax sp. YR216]
MNHRLLGLFVACAVVLLAFAALAVALTRSDGAPPGTIPPPAPPGTLPIAVLGDSNSHSYQDRVAFPLGSHERGGALRDQTFQWTEVLARLRGNELDFGPWVHWGRPWWSAWARDRVGLLPSRTPIKEDYLYNFATSGGACKNLMGDGLGFRYPQVPRLLALMKEQPGRWQNGVVVIYIGANDWNPYLDVMARDPDAPELRRVIGYCTQQIGRAIEAIHALHPSVRILLAGITNQGDDPALHGKYRDATSPSNIRKALAGANAAFRGIAEADPKRIAFFDANAWAVERWGVRGPHGEPDFKSVHLGRLTVTHTMGDEPGNTMLVDDHAGLAWNVLWAQSILARLREAFGLPLTPISDDEAARFVDATTARP